MICEICKTNKFESEEFKICLACLLKEFIKHMEKRQFSGEMISELRKFLDNRRKIKVAEEFQ